MKITITGRHLEITPALRDYAEKKIEKLEKYFHQLIDTHVIMSVEKLDHVMELMMNGDGVQFYAVEKAGDMYSSVDLLIDKMEKQIVRYREKLSEHKVVPLRMMETVEVGSAGGVDLVLNQVSNKPKSDIEAYLEMKLSNRDFILYKKGGLDEKTDSVYASKNYAVIYKNEKGIKQVEIDFEKSKQNHFAPGSFVESDVHVESDSPAKPKIKFRKQGKCAVEKITVGEALQKMMNSEEPYMTFFNSETNYFNIIYKNGRSYEVMVPAF